jgi:hypothetical protein
MERLSTNHFIYYISKTFFLTGKNVLHFASMPVKERLHLSEVSNWGVIERKVDHDIKTVLFLDMTSCILVDNTSI